ncbi:MAG: serine hydrolase [Cyanobacteria bacterium J06576_12]
MATAYKAKLLCSGIFVSGRDKLALLQEDLAVGSLAPLRLLSSKVDFENKTVTVSFLGGFKRVALYRPGLGSTLVLDRTVEELRLQSVPFHAWCVKHPMCDYLLPIAEETLRGIDRKRLAQTVESAFAQKEARTRAVVVLYQGKIVAERYAAEFSAETPMLGWSMAKSVVNALVGILVKEEKLSLTSKCLLPEWQGDLRRAITLDQLLKMNSGLRFSEEYANPCSDVITMLFHRGDGAAYAAQRPL